MATKRLLIGLLIAALVTVLSVVQVPLASGKGESSITVQLAPYEGNPILTPDKANAWEAGATWRARVVYEKGLFHMFYTGYAENMTAGSVGYATSEDGLHWTKYEDNPVFVPDKTLAPNGVMEFGILLDDGTWKLYFTPWLENRQWWELAGETLVATAPSPTGPWTVASEPVLTSKETDWDVGGRWTVSLLRSNDEYLMFYESNLASGMAIGMATSPDGLRWTKYDDPATTATTSDPVFEANSNGAAWDSGFVASPVVRMTNEGWEMFYAGGADPTVLTRSVGYATSSDGITWVRYGDTPLLTDPGGPAESDAAVEVDGTSYLYYTALGGISVATVTYQ